MKKVVIPALMVSVALLTPLGIGFVVKKQYHQLYQVASASSLPVKLEFVDYHQGWFTSDALVRLTLEAPATADFETPAHQLKNFQLDFVQKIYHGPIILRGQHPFINTIDRMTFALAVADITINQADLQFNLTNKLRFDGSDSIQLNCPRIAETIDPERGWKFALQGLQGEIDINRQMTQTNGKFTLAALDFVRNDTAQHFKNAQFSYQLTKDELDLWHGKRDFTLAAIVFALSAKEQLAVEGVTLGLHDLSVNKKLSSTLYAHINDVKLDATDYGSQQLSVHLDNIDAIALNKIGEKAAEFENRNLPTNALFLELFPQVVDLVQKGFSIHISPLDLNTSWGPIKGEANVNVPVNTEKNPSLDTLMNNITADGKIQFPGALLQELLVMLAEAKPDAAAAALDSIQRWQLAGWLIPEGNQFLAEFIFKQNQLQINGKMLKIPAMSISTTEQVKH